MLRNSRRSFTLNTWCDSEELTLKISALSSDGAGIARTDRGIVFVQGALPGETVRAAVVLHKKDFTVAETVHVEEASAGRVHPKCKYFGKCGGCQLQHADYSDQILI
ncbi:MAG: TRAM domain-containing protein [Synergistaceae bacterium]|nr:TRAM domain-containing protein [Synergistaceae bacterium]